MARWKWTVLAVCSIGLLTSGCYYVADPSCYHSPQHLEEFNGPYPIEFTIDGVQFRAKLQPTCTIVFIGLPGITSIVMSDNPYHLELWTDWKDVPRRNIEFKRVTVETPGGPCLFNTEGPAAFDARNVPEVGRAHLWPVLVPNARCGDLRRRRTSRNGWPNSAAIQIPKECEKLVLRVRFEDADGEQPAEHEGSVELIRCHHLIVEVLTKNIFWVTGEV